MINNVVLVGRLTRNPELRSTGSGISVATFTLAVDRQYSNASGQRDADFISCVMWRKNAENFCKFAEKGRLVGVQGEIETRTYDDKDGKRVYVTEVKVNNFSWLDSKKDRVGQQAPQGSYNQYQGNQPQSNFNQPQQAPQPPQETNGGFGDPINVSSDDLPF